MQKAIKVIESCVTCEQLKVAEKYVYLYVLAEENIHNVIQIGEILLNKYKQLLS